MTEIERLQLAERVIELERALKFYADSDNYKKPKFSTYPSIHYDGGHRARHVLYGGDE